MLPKFKFEFVNGERSPRILLRLTGRLQDWKSFWIGYFLPLYLNEVQQNFETEGELSTSMGWPDLHPAYASWKARHFPGTKILERTRRLRNSLMPGATGPDTLIQVRPLELKVGTRVPYAKYHRWTRPFMPRVLVKDWNPRVRAWARGELELARREG